MDSNMDQLLDEDEEVIVETALHTRRVTSLDNIRKAVDLSVEFHPVTFLPLGKPGNKFTSWVGLETRSKISILLSDWKKVDKSLKDHLWLSIQKHWNIPNDKNTTNIKKSTLKIANTSWRNFKKNLIGQYLKKRKSPIMKYTYITPATWTSFCRLKTTREFLAKSQKGKDLVQLNKNPHRLGSRGYLGKKPQWDKEKAQGKCPELFGISTERARDFLLARRVKAANDDYVLPENMQELANQIIEKEQSTPGEDSLLGVLGKEHSGRTRGVSHIVGTRTTLPDLANKKRKQEDINILKRMAEEQQRLLKDQQRMMEEQKREIDESKARQKRTDEQLQILLSQHNIQIQPRGSPGEQHSSEGSAACLDWATSLEEPTPCQLIQGSTRLACGKGLVYPIGNGILHNVPMMPGHVKVQVDMIYDGFGEIDLPVPNEFMETLLDANGGFVEWPHNDVLLLRASKSKDVKASVKPSHVVEKGSSQKLTSPPPQVQKQDNGAQSKLKKPTQKPKVKQPVSSSMPAKMLTRPKELQNFYSRLNSKDEWRHMGVRIEAKEEVFGAERKTIVVSYDELYDLLRRGMLESNIIAAFMSALHLVLTQKARNNKCAFLHPETISATEIKNCPSHVTNAIFDAFIAPYNKNKDFFLAPYTQGGHWVLLLVLPKRHMVYVLDASHLESRKKPESYHIKPLMESAISKFDLLTKVSSQPVTWIMVKCNQQKSTWECGYYVCKWLFRFVMEQQYTFPQENPWSTESFSDAEVDGVAVAIVNRLNI